MAAGATVELVVAGRGGVPDDATSAVLNVGAVRATEAGYITVFPCGEEQPLASSINYRGDDVISNSVTAQIGEDGKVCIYTLRETDMITDVTGFVEPVMPVPSCGLIIPGRRDDGLNTRSAARSDHPVTAGRFACHGSPARRMPHSSYGEDGRT